MQPVLFTILFVYLFGAAMVLPGGGSYKDFAIGGLIAMNLTTASFGTAVGLATDLSTGVMNRFRTLPMSRSAILAGRTISDLLASLLCGTIVLVTGFIIGWRPDNGLARRGRRAGRGAGVLLRPQLVLGRARAGHRRPRVGAGGGARRAVPGGVRVERLRADPGPALVMRVIAEWNPVSAVAASCRELFGNPNPAALSDSFPSQHPVFMALAWSVVILAVCAPLASRLLQRRTTD